MKFEKFFKSVGTHGQVVNRANGDKWLVCNGVGMLVPPGVVNLMGAGSASEIAERIVETLVHADTDDAVVLTKAVLPTADGKPRDIVRVFSDGLDVEVGICNTDFGLLEKSDVRTCEVEIEIDTEGGTSCVNYLVVQDPTGENVVGFIQGVPYEPINN